MKEGINLPNRIVFNNQPENLKIQLYGADPTTPVEISPDGSIPVCIPDNTFIQISGVPSIAIDQPIEITGLIGLTAGAAVSISGTPTVLIGNALELSGIPTVALADAVAVTGALDLAAGAAVAISGTPTVLIGNALELSGIPTVALADAVAVTGALDLAAGAAVSISGVPTVSLAGAVAISGVPTVSLAGAVSISGVPTVSLAGAVSITGVPTVSLAGAVSITGVPAVTIPGGIVFAGTPTVVIGGRGFTSILLAATTVSSAVFLTTIATTAIDVSRFSDYSYAVRVEPNVTNVGAPLIIQPQVAPINNPAYFANSGTAESVPVNTISNIVLTNNQFLQYSRLAFTRAGGGGTGIIGLTIFFQGQY